MSEFKGTKGKWQYAHRKQSNDSGMYSTEVFCSQGNTIATLAWYPMPPRKEIIDGKECLVTGTYRESNALLISKAPELLESLNEITSTFTDEELIQCIPSFAEKIKRAKKLIKEATTL